CPSRTDPSRRVTRSAAVMGLAGTPVVKTHTRLTGIRTSTIIHARDGRFNDPRLTRRRLARKSKTWRRLGQHVPCPRPAFDGTLCGGPARREAPRRAFLFLVGPIPLYSTHESRSCGIRNLAIFAKSRQV